MTIVFDNVGVLGQLARREAVLAYVAYDDAFRVLVSFPTPEAVVDSKLLSHDIPAVVPQVGDGYSVSDVEDASPGFGFGGGGADPSRWGG